MGEIRQLEDLSASLAADLASGLHSATDTFARHDITPEQAKALLKDPRFTDMVKQYKAEWGHVRNTKERLKLKAQLALEEALMPIFQIIKGSEPASAKVAAFKELKQMAGMETQDEVKTAGSGLPSVVIYLGGDNDEPIDITPSKIDKKPEKTGPDALIWEDDD